MAQLKDLSAKLKATVFCLLVMPSCLAGEQAPNSRAPGKQPTAANAAKSGFCLLADRYFTYRFRHNPDQATVLGFHEYDRLAPDYSYGAICSDLKELRTFRMHFASCKVESLSKQEKIDLELIKSDINSQILELEETRDWQKNPDLYSSQASSMIYDLLSRDFAPLCQRLPSIIAREKKIPDLLLAGKRNLKNPPRVFTELAIEQLPGIIELFEISLEQKVKELKNPVLYSEFKKANLTAIAALKSYKRYLEKELLPVSKGSFALGPDLFAKKLACEEMEYESLDSLLKRGETEMRRLQQEFLACAREINPSKPAAQVFTEISSEHCAAEKLIASVAAVLNQLKEFCIEHRIVSIPEEDNLQVAETPAFMRALTFAAMDSPGPFEQRAKEAYYYVTLPEKNWDKKKVEEHMRAFSNYDLINTSVHEAFPGHYVQGLWTRLAPSKTAKILGCNSNVEGWAHYCEQMMLDEGLYEGNKKLKMVVLHDALLRCARFVVAIKLHCKGMSIKEGTEYFVKEAYQEKANAELETIRGTMDPTYLVYTLGKLQIIELREEYKRAKGEQFRLKEFHDRFLSTGSPPVKLVRELIF